MKGKNTKTTRVDTSWEKDVRNVMGIRLSRGLANPRVNEISTAEFTRLVRNAPSWPRVIDELKTLPKRKR